MVSNPHIHIICLNGASYAVPQHDQDHKNKYHYKRRQKAAESILENQHESGNGIPTVEEFQILRQLCILIDELIQLGNRDASPFVSA